VMVVIPMEPPGHARNPVLLLGSKLKGESALFHPR
jgi:hypothetical protein